MVNFILKISFRLSILGIGTVYVASSFDGVSRANSVPTGPVVVLVYSATSHCCALLSVERCSGSWSVASVRGALLRRFSGLSEDQRAGLCATASILYSILAPVCARLAPDHCLMHRGQTPPASHQRCGSCGRLWLQMEREESHCPAEPCALRRVVHPPEERRLSVVGGCP